MWHRRHGVEMLANTMPNKLPHDAQFVLVSNAMDDL